jgi:small neutral amino acid transporter SnatA (MarC family)
MNLLGWMKSTRSIAVILTFALLFVALFKNLLSGEQVMAIATGVILAYFGKRDTNEDRGEKV